MSNTTTFQITIDLDENELTTRIQNLGFEKKDNGFEDAQGRTLTIDDGTLKLTLQKTDLIDEHEQLEHILGNLGLDPDNAKTI